MKKTIPLREGWTLQGSNGMTEILDIPHMPMQVHDVLFHHGLIDDTHLFGRTENCRWVPEQTWTYRTTFHFPAWEGPVRLCFKGVDTCAQFHLNGMLVGQHEDAHLPAFVDVTHAIRQDARNTLEVVFPPFSMLLEKVIPNKDARVKAIHHTRKPFHDFTAYLGAKPDFIRVGLYDTVYLEQVDRAEIVDFELDYALDDKLDSANISIHAQLSGDTASGYATLRVYGPQEELLFQDDSPHGCFRFVLEKIRLWWPRSFGEQPLYTFILNLYTDAGVILDQKTKRTGFRKIEMVEYLDFTVNHLPIKLWGANLTPIDGKTLCENEERTEEIVRLAHQGNMNVLRVWGEGIPFTDKLYDLSDELGILLWQEFFCGNAQYPKEGKVIDLILQEAEYLVLRLRHRPSILLWCGGNENFMHRDFNAPGEEYLAASLFEHDFRLLCGRLDPMRRYLVTSPYGGNYTNSGATGDTHSYTNSWYVPWSGIPGFVSENLRVSLPCERSLKRYLRTPTLPVPTPFTYGSLPWPPELEAITSAESYKKTPPVEQYYVAATMRDLIYNFGAAAGNYLRETVERYRRGKTIQEPFGRRRCHGHLVWKLNTTFPHIYSSVLDYYLEPKMAYHFLKRSYEPILLSVEMADNLNIWVVNDTAQDICGHMQAELFDMAKNAVCKTLRRPVFLSAGQSAPVGTLDDFGQFSRDKVIRVMLHDDQKGLVADISQFVDIERHILFPEAVLAMVCEGGELVVTTDRFAHHVELSGDADGDLFGFRFSDNYFDLFPHQTKRIGVSGKHKKGTLSARSAYCSQVASVDYSVLPDTD